MHNKPAAKLVKLCLILLAVISSNVQADFYDSRVKKWEFYLAPQITNAKVLQFENGAEANIEKDSSIGFGVGYNLNSHIELALEFGSNNSNYTSTVAPGEDPPDPAQLPVTSSGSLYTSTINFGFTLRYQYKVFLKGRYRFK